MEPRTVSSTNLFFLCIPPYPPSSPSLCGPITDLRNVCVQCFHSHYTGNIIYWGRNEYPMGYSYSK